MGGIFLVRNTLNSHIIIPAINPKKLIFFSLSS